MLTQALEVVLVLTFCAMFFIPNLGNRRKGVLLMCIAALGGVVVQGQVGASFAQFLDLHFDNIMQLQSIPEEAKNSWQASMTLALIGFVTHLVIWPLRILILKNLNDDILSDAVLWCSGAFWWWALMEVSSQSYFQVVIFGAWLVMGLLILVKSPSKISLSAT